MSDPFAKITKKNGTASKSAASKIAAAVNPKIKQTVDRVIELKAKIKQLEADESQAEQTIIEHVQPQQELQARQGNFSKSFLVEGQTGSLTYIVTDKFSVPKDEEVHEELKKMLGQKFDEFFEYKRTVALNEKVQENTTLVNKIIKACETAGISLAEAFNVTDVLVSKKDLDKRQYELDANTLATFKSLVKQYKPSLK